MLNLNKTAADIRADMARISARIPDFTDLGDLEQRAAAGMIQVFPLHSSSIIGCIVQNGNIGHLIGAAGDMAEILAFEPELCQFYLGDHNCSRLALRGRRGWLRALRPLGWKAGPDDNELSKSRLEWCIRRGAGLKG